MRKKYIICLQAKANTKKPLSEIIEKNKTYDIKYLYSSIELLGAIKLAPPELIIINTAFLRINCEKLIEKIKKLAPEIPIIVITKYVNDQHIIHYFKLGVAAYILFPAEKQEVNRIIAEVIKRKVVFNYEYKETITIANPNITWVQLVMPSELKYLERFKQFIFALGDKSIHKEDKKNIITALSEIVVNAIEWGNKNDVNKKIEISYLITNSKAVIKVTDDGDGFDQKEVFDPKIPLFKHIENRMLIGKRPGGYGLFTTKKIVDKLTFNKIGNSVTITKKLQIIKSVDKKNKKSMRILCTQ